MNQKLTAVVVALGFLFTTAIATTTVHATNESDYKWGYNGGKSEWQSCAFTNGEGDCTYALHPLQTLSLELFM
jgi:hypothetical protein